VTLVVTTARLTIQTMNQTGASQRGRAQPACDFPMIARASALFEHDRGVSGMRLWVPGMRLGVAHLGIYL
jgi:hypothetical protein